MKLVICGSRSFDNFDLALKTVSQMLADGKEISLIISGGTRGADYIGEKVARALKIKLKIMYAQWDKYGKGAGYVRNEQMLKEADAVLAFWDGESRGTNHMIDITKQAEKELNVVNF